jgi:5-methyltetrahydropteroyltriglutamate--homocysteine methyltransferase
MMRCAARHRLAINSSGLSTSATKPQWFAPRYASALSGEPMLKATKNVTLPTTITGSLPRPVWHTESLGMRTFLEAMRNSRFREQYLDTVAVHLKDEETAGLDIVTDGDTHFDEEVAGNSWASYPLLRMSGLDLTHLQPTRMKIGGPPFPMGHILHDYIEARVLPKVVGPIGRGELQYAALYKAAQRLTSKPVKFGTIGPELLATSVEDVYYKDPVERIYGFADALNEELHDLADAGCPAIQYEEPQIHMIPTRGNVLGRVDMAGSVEVFNRTVRGLRSKTEVWCHTCWGNPAQQRMFTSIMSYQPSLEKLNGIDADVITFESCSAGGIDLEAFGKTITEKKIAIGVVDHHSLQVERPEEIAGHVREALKHIPAERLVISSDCGMGREGMSRRHSRYKMISMVLGTNMVRRELGLPEADCISARPGLSLVAF